MVTRGRNICNTLKAIRKQIADANEIEYSPEECHFKGECKGTCPKCEQDVRYLEKELRLKQIAGKVIKVAGVALGITTIRWKFYHRSKARGYDNCKTHRLSRPSHQTFGNEPRQTQYCYFNWKHFRRSNCWYRS